MKAGSRAPPAGRADRKQVRALPRVRDTQPEIRQNLHPAGPHQVPACLVAREGRLIGERHPGTGPGQHQRGDAAGRPGTDHHRIEARAHRASTIASARVQCLAQAPTGTIALPLWPHGGTDPTFAFVTLWRIYLLPEE